MLGYERPIPGRLCWEHMVCVMVKNLDETVELLIIFKFHKTQATCLSKLTLFGLNSRNQ